MDLLVLGIFPAILVLVICLMATSDSYKGEDNCYLNSDLLRKYEMEE